MAHTLNYLHHAPLAAGAAAYGLDALWRRAGTLRQAFRRHGMAGVAMAVAGRLPGRLVCVEWFAIFETLVPGEPAPRDGLEIRRADDGDVLMLAAVGHSPATELRDRLADGDVAYLGLVDGEPVGYFWYRSGSWREDDIEFRLRDDERWGYDAFVRPSHRGKGISPAIATHALLEMRQEGVVRVISVIDHLNEASRRAAGHYGARPIASVLTIGVLGLGFVYERDGSEQRPSVRLYRRRAGIVRRPPPSPLPA